MLQRTAKSCGPDAPTLASSSRSCVGPTGLKQNISVSDGGKRARSPGRARRKPLEPLRAGMPGDSGVLVVTRVRSIATICTRDRGCNGHPAFPTPSKGRNIQSKTRALRVARTKSYAGPYQRHCEERKRRSNPYFLCGKIDCFACARNDGTAVLQFEFSHVVPAKAGTHSHRRLLDGRFRTAHPTDKARRIGSCFRRNDEEMEAVHLRDTH